MKKIMFYFCPSVVTATRKADEEGQVSVVPAQEDVASLKEKTAAIRSQADGKSVFLRDASKFIDDVESHVLGVVLHGPHDSPHLKRVGKAYEKIQKPIAFSDEIDEEAFGLSEPSDEDPQTLAELKAKATELGVSFGPGATEEELTSAIQEHVNNSKPDEDEFDPETASVEDLKAYAEDNGIEFASNIGEEKLRQRVVSHHTDSNQNEGGE